MRIRLFCFINSGFKVAHISRFDTKRNPSRVRLTNLNCVSNKAKHFESRERGQSLVEFVIIFPILLLMLAGIAEIGFMYITAYTVENASREGARMAVTLNALVTNDSRVIGRVEDLIPATAFYTGFHGGTTNDGISDCSINDQVTVTVTGTYNFVALRFLGLTSIQLSFPTTMRYELCG